MAGRHRRDAPILATWIDGKAYPRIKPRKAQITQKTASGTTLPKETGKLWGIFSGKRGRNVS